MKFAIEVPFQDTDGRPIYVVVSKSSFDAAQEYLEELGVPHGTMQARNVDVESLGLVSSHQLINEPVDGDDPTAFRGAILIE